MIRLFVGGLTVAQTKKKKMKKKNPGRLVITNQRKGKKKRSNPRGGFISSSMKKIGTEFKDAGYILAGRYAAEVASAAGSQYLDEHTAEFGGPIAGVGAWFAIKKLWKGQGGRLARLGLLSEVTHELLVDKVGVDIPEMVADMLPGREAAPEEEAEEGAAPPAAEEAGGGAGMQALKRVMRQGGMGRGRYALTG